MTPGDHKIHAFIADLNRHITACADLAIRDVPTTGTDEFEAYLNAVTRAEGERANLTRRFEQLLYQG